MTKMKETSLLALWKSVEKFATSFLNSIAAILVYLPETSRLMFITQCRKDTVTCIKTSFTKNKNDHNKPVVAFWLFYCKPWLRKMKKILLCVLCEILHCETELLVLSQMPVLWTSFQCGHTVTQRRVIFGYLRILTHFSKFESSVCERCKDGGQRQRKWK